MRHYTLIIEHNDGRVLSWNFNEKLYAELLYHQWERSKVITNIKSGILVDNLTQSIICSFGI